jgi:predicted Zn-dependent protease
VGRSRLQLVSNLGLLGALLIGASQRAGASIYATVPSEAKFDIGNSLEVERRIAAEVARIGDNPTALHDLGTILYRQHLPEAAHKLWDQAAARHADLAVGSVEVIFERIQAGDLNGAEAALAAVQPSRPNDPHVQLAVGQLAMARRNFAAAKSAYDRAAELAPDSYLVMLTRGQYWQHVGEMARARTDFETAAQKEPDLAAAWLFLALDDFRNNRIDDCRSHLANAEEPGVAESLAERRLAEFYLEVQDYPAAYHSFVRAARQQPDDLLLKTRVGQTLTLMRRDDDARAVLSGICDRSDYLPALIALAQLEETAGQWQSCRALLERALAADPNNIIANNNLAMLLVQLDQEPKRALELATHAGSLAPNLPEIQSTYGCALAHAGQYADAVRALTEAVRREPNEPWLRYCFGKALMDSGNTEAAREQWTACLLLDEEFPRREQLRSVISEEIVQADLWSK